MPERPIDVVNEQAEDEGLWFDAETLPEAYLQQELRRLHAAVEAAAGAAALEHGARSTEAYRIFAEENEALRARLAAAEELLRREHAEHRGPGFLPRCEVCAFLAAGGDPDA